MSALAPVVLLVAFTLLVLLGLGACSALVARRRCRRLGHRWATYRGQDYRCDRCGRIFLDAAEQ